VLGRELKLLEKHCIQSPVFIFNIVTKQKLFYTALFSSKMMSSFSVKDPLKEASEVPQSFVDVKILLSGKNFLARVYKLIR
jgi:hypothetical protein